MTVFGLPPGMSSRASCPQHGPAFTIRGALFLSMDVEYFGGLGSYSIPTVSRANHGRAGHNNSAISAQSKTIQQKC
jgi:hypothetical protein